MNTATINSKEVMQEIIDIEILITGDIEQQKEEVAYNTWEMWFDRDFVKTLTLQDMHFFLEKLMENRSKQVVAANKGPATFYLWYSEQYSCLSFDVLSGTNIKLPFGCTTNIVHNPLTILNTFLKENQDEIHPLDWENFTILNPGDPGFDDDDDEDNSSSYVLNVFVITLPQANISAFLKKLIS